MREPPKLTGTTIQALLHTHYGLSITSLTFLPIGNDSASFVYRVDATDTKCYFLKVRANSGFSASSLVIPRFLYEHGIPYIITPLPTTTQALWVRVSDFTLSLYPFIDARTAATTGLSFQHWHALGATLHRIHACQLPPDLHQLVPHESFIPSRRHVLTALEAAVHTDLTDPLQRELAVFWQTRQADIRLVIDRADTLGRQLRFTSPPLVLCHADLHTWNVLLDVAQQLWIVDWDEVILAPKERDLMFVIKGIGHDLVTSHETTSFLQGYGDAAIDRQALVYYRYAWAVQDMGAYAEQVFFAPDSSAQVRHAAVHDFIDIFTPGNIVTLARESDSNLP